MLYIILREASALLVLLTGHAKASDGENEQQVWFSRISFIKTLTNISHMGTVTH